MKDVKIEIGNEVLYQGKTLTIIKILDLYSVLASEKETGYPIRAEIKNLKSIEDSTEDQQQVFRDLATIHGKDWEKAQKRYEIILPILQEKGNLSLIEEISDKYKIHRATIYRWIELYNSTGTIISLVDKRRTGGKNKSRLDKDTEAIIQKAIEEVYLNPQRASIKKTILEIQKICRRMKIEPPHSNTIRNRIKNISDELQMKLRYSSKKAKEKYEPSKGHFPGADYPLSTVQIDHTPMDIILVDEVYRKPVGRPWLTLAIDIYSRMVVGFYLSFDPPGAAGTGLCLANAILPKEMLLNKLDVSGEWPCWGVMKTIHCDNAKEFRGNMIKRACEKYGIEISWRPVGTPHWGGHIERFLGTFLKEVHDLPGTTFSNVQERSDYPSEKKAAFTLQEFEKWLVTFIVNVYHQRIHSALNKSPLQQFEEGLLGSETTIGTGIKPRMADGTIVRLDFMPYEERTVQEYGVSIDKIHYYSDVLRKYIHSTESGKLKAKKKYIFKRDPRDISVIYFYDEDSMQYHPIPYRNTGRSPMSIWEYREVLKRLKDQGKENIDEDKIFEAYDEMQEIERKAIQETKKVKRLTRSVNTSKEHVHKDLNKNINKVLQQKSVINKKDIKPFEEID